MRDHTVYEIRPDLRVVSGADDWALLITETERRRVSGKLYVDILSALSTPLAGGQLRAQLAVRHSQIEVHYGIQQLMNAGYVVDQTAGSPLRRMRSGAAAPRVAINVRAGGAEVVARTFTECGLAIADDAAVVISVVDDYLDPRLADAIECALAAGRTCIPFKPEGGVAWLGPSFGPDIDSCWNCLLHRIQVNRPVEMYLHRTGHALVDVIPRARHSAATLGAAALFAGCELMRRLAPADRVPGCTNGPHAPALANLVTLDLERMVRREHLVVRRPQCPRCGDARWMSRQLERPVVLESRRKRSTTDGGHRIESADTTYARLACHVDPMIGAITHLGEMPHKHHARRPVFTASHFLTPPPGAATHDERFDQISVGKGVSIAQARTSALCEALERQCARVQGDEPRMRASLRELSTAAIDPRTLLLFSERQYLEGTPQLARARLLATPRSQHVPLAVDPDQPIDWAPAWSLTAQTRKLVPFSYVFAGAPQPPAEQFCRWDSNGCAAGNCIEEAILQGLFELVERDATAIWWYNRVPRPEVVLDSVAQPYFCAVRDHYAQAGHDVWLLDLTHDLGIPVVIALAHERNTGRFAAGLGCHLEGALAVQRALTELHQVFDPDHRHDPLFHRAEIEDDRFLFPSRDETACTATRDPQPPSEDLRDDLELCIRRLRDANLEVLVANYSRPDVALATVKVMVPGLRHFWPRFAPGRLYDVPVTLGWRSKPVLESQLNPIPLLM